MARTFAPSTGSPVQVLTKPLIVPNEVAKLAFGYEVESEATSSASSVCRSVVLIENGCIVGTQRAVLVDREADRRVREAERVAELVDLRRLAVVVAAGA